MELTASGDSVPPPRPWADKKLPEFRSLSCIGRENLLRSSVFGNWMKHPIAKERNSVGIVAEICVGVQVPSLSNCEKLFSGACPLGREVS